MAQGKGSTAVEPGNMLWLIQRDFLEGKTVDAMVKEALAPVTNPHADHDISQVLPSVWTHRGDKQTNGYVLISLHILL